MCQKVAALQSSCSGNVSSSCWAGSIPCALTWFSSVAVGTSPRGQGKGMNEESCDLKHSPWRPDFDSTEVARA